jgi:hypothetical protein
MSANGSQSHPERDANSSEFLANSQTANKRESDANPPSSPAPAADDNNDGNHKNNANALRFIVSVQTSILVAPPTP